MPKDLEYQKKKAAKRRLKQLGKTINPSVAGWSDSDEELAIGQEGNVCNS
jgi:hypothetical protein